MTETISQDDANAESSEDLPDFVELILDEWGEENVWVIELPS